MRFAVVFLVPLMGTAFSAFGQPLHMGTWAIDYANSDRGEVVLRFDDLGSGLWQFSANGRRILQFRMDDNQCATCVASEPWKVIGPETWDTGWLGPSGVADIVTIAPDGGSLSITSRESARNGEPIDRVRTFQRLSGGSGLAGVWQMEADRSTSPPLIELSPGVDEWLVFKSPTEGRVCVLLLDGVDYPCFAASSPGWTIAMTVNAARALAVVIKKGGDTAEDSTYTVSPDGRSMTQMQRSASGRSIRTVYRLQQ
ncbi:MAG TPA: hypothetical protein VFB99_13435 [Vicinamibacterales bacterium]|nr:hypothetical protein [Vicinamibacterales bacterium]